MDKYIVVTSPLTSGQQPGLGLYTSDQVLPREKSFSSYIGMGVQVSLRFYYIETGINLWSLMVFRVGRSTAAKE